MEKSSGPSPNSQKCESSSRKPPHFLLPVGNVTVEEPKTLLERLKYSSLTSNFCYKINHLSVTKFIIQVIPSSVYSLALNGFSSAYHNTSCNSSRTAFSVM